jgi:hypothetical protein
MDVLKLSPQKCSGKNGGHGDKISIGNQQKTSPSSLAHPRTCPTISATYVNENLGILKLISLAFDVKVRAVSNPTGLLTNNSIQVTSKVQDLGGKKVGAEKKRRTR